MFLFDITDLLDTLAVFDLAWLGSWRFWLVCIGIGAAVGGIFVPGTWATIGLIVLGIVLILIPIVALIRRHRDTQPDDWL
jgi:hypothetical protein